jgi:hypothetical protein
LFCHIPLLYWFPRNFTVDGNGGFGANNGANTATRAARGDHLGRVIAPFGCAHHIQRKNLLGTTGNTRFTSFAKIFVDFNATLWGHFSSCQKNIAAKSAAFYHF